MLTLDVEETFQKGKAPPPLKSSSRPLKSKHGGGDELKYDRFLKCKTELYTVHKLFE